LKPIFIFTATNTTNINARKTANIIKNSKTIGETVAETIPHNNFNFLKKEL